MLVETLSEAARLSFVLLAIYGGACLVLHGLAHVAPRVDAAIEGRRLRKAMGRKPRALTSDYDRQDIETLRVRIRELRARQEGRAA